MLTPTDEALAAAAAEGDLAAYDSLMQRHQALVFKVAFGFAGARDGALDIVQAAFLKAFRNRARFQGRSTWKTWLLRIVLNEGQDWQRRLRRSDYRHQPLELVADRRAPEPSPEDDALRNERRACLLRGLLGLNPRHSLALVLRYFEGLRIPEIAALLGCSELTARNMMSRSLRRLHAELAPEIEGKR